MSKRYWFGYSSLALIILMAAFSCGYWLVSDYRKIHTYQRNEAASYKPGSDDKEFYDPCARSGIIDGLNCVIREAKASREDKRSEYDLQAQQDMAAWALWMVLISGASILVTAVGIIFVKMTLDEARRTTRAALRNNVHSRIAAAQARTANEISEKARLDHDRPWVLFDKIRTNSGDWYNNANCVGFQFTFVLHNYGHTPAIVSRAEAIITAADTLDEAVQGISAHIMFRSPVDEIATDSIIVGPDSESRDLTGYGPHTFVGRPDAQELAVRFRTGKRFVWIIAALSYRDVHGREHQTHCCYRQQFSHYSLIEFGGADLNYRT